MEPIPIGEAARRLGLRTSALRYYEERGLVRPARVNGTRVYGLPELRRLAFLRVAQELGVSLDTAGAVLDDASEHWRAAVAGQIAELETLITRAETAIGLPDARPAVSRRAPGGRMPAHDGRPRPVPRRQRHLRPARGREPGLRRPGETADLTSS